MTTDLATSFSTFAAQLREFIHLSSSGHAAASDAQFDRSALELFALQFAHNAPYRRFCEARQMTPYTVRDWRDIPAIPTAGFKELELTSLARDDRTQVFHSSGTTEQRPSRHFHNADSMAIYEASLLLWFRQHLLPDAVGLQSFAMLTPPPSQACNSSLAHMFETVHEEFGSPDSVFTGKIHADGSWILDLEKTLDTLRARVLQAAPVIVLGTAFSFVHLLDALKERGERIQLPAGSSILETGGYKGRSRVLPKEELHTLITSTLGVPAERIVCEYGMSELSSQAYDGKAGKARTNGRIFQFPSWARAQIISPESGREVGEAETGLIRVFDLANVYSVMAIQTEDLGVRRGGGFELLGRAAQAEPRGCSLRSH